MKSSTKHKSSATVRAIAMPLIVLTFRLINEFIRLKQFIWSIEYRYCPSAVKCYRSVITIDFSRCQ